MRAKLLDMAKEIVCNNRESQYGTPEDNFKVIADLWRAYLHGNTELNEVDVAMMLGLLKVARIRTGTFKEDSFVDLAGYTACGYEIAEKKNKAMEVAREKYPQVTIDEVIVESAVNELLK